MGIFIVSIGLGALALFLAFDFLIAALLSQRSVPFPRRLASCLLFGMAIPLVIAGAGMLTANYASHDWLMMTDRANPAWLFCPALLSLVLGIAWGALRYRRLHKTTS